MPKHDIALLCMEYSAASSQQGMVGCNNTNCLTWSIQHVENMWKKGASHMIEVIMRRNYKAS